MNPAHLLFASKNLSLLRLLKGKKVYKFLNNVQQGYDIHVCRKIKIDFFSHFSLPCVLNCCIICMSAASTRWEEGKT